MPSRPNTATPQAASAGPTGFRLLAVAVLVAAVAQFFRNAHVVVAPDIMRDLGISARAFASLTSALFLASALVQLPGGILIDRYGSRRCVPLMLLFTGAGAALFGLATGTGLLIAGRVMMGVGLAVIVMAGIVFCARWFDPRHFAWVAVIIVGSSHLGSLGSTVPMALLSDGVGWRGAYLTLAGCTLLLAALAWAVIRDAPTGHAWYLRQPESLRDAAGGIGEVLRVPGIGRLLALAFCGYATLSCVVGLWGGPYLNDVHGLDTVERGRVLFWMAAGVFVGYFAFTLADHRSRNTRGMILFGAGGSALVFALMAAVPQPAVGLVKFLFGILGLLAGYNVLVISHGRRFYPERLAGRGITVVNCAVLFGAATLQFLTGLLVGGSAEPGASVPESAYRIVFALLAAVLAVASVIYRKCPAGGAAEGVGR